MDADVYDVWLGLHIAPGSVSWHRPVSALGTAEALWRASRQELLAAGAPERLASALEDKSLERARDVLGFCGRYGAQLLIWGRDDYPGLLRGIPDPPYLLYALGRMPDTAAGFGCAVVGSRRMSEYGMRTAYKISYGLAAAGAVVVSGLARGIDAMAACGALEAGGSTVAVLGCGLDTAYPREHRELLRHVVSDGGCAVSEYPPGTRPYAGNFPKRNRVISGLCQCTVVVEAAADSGALLTARETLLQGRTLFAVPGNVDEPNAAGTNTLLRSGASVAVCAADILGSGCAPDLTHGADGTEAADLCPELRPGTAEKYGLRDPFRGADTDSRESAAGEAFAPAGAEKARDGKEKDEKTGPEENGGGNGNMPAGARAPLPDEEAREFYAGLPEGVRFTADTLIARGIDPGKVFLQLSILEVLGYVTGIPGGAYLKNV